MRTFVREVISHSLSLFWKLGRGFRQHSATWTAQSNSLPTDSSEAIRSVLRRFPYWSEGHLRLGAYALEARDLLSAYSCAHCTLALTPPTSPEGAAALHLLGRIYLQQGAFEKCLENLDSAAPHIRRDADKSKIREDRAAALMALQRNEEALKILESIPATHITAEGRAALLFLKRRK